MDRLTWSLVSGVFQVLYLHVVVGNNCYNFTGSCCSHCNPGFYLTQKCGRCAQCPEDGYADKPNDRYSCKLCNRCEGEYASDASDKSRIMDFSSGLVMYSTSRKTTVPFNPEQNGVAERRNRTLCESGRSMLFDANLPTAYWGEAIMTACYLQNRLPGPFTYISMCTSTRDAVCTCTAGKRCKDEKCSQCTKAQCPAGQQRVGDSCNNCPPETFNDGKVPKCTPWKNCSAVGEEIITHGNLTSDVVCGPYKPKVTQSSSSSATTTPSITTNLGKVMRPPSEESNLQIIYIVITSSLGLLLIVICVACRQKLMEKIKQACQKIPKPVVKQAEEEDGCSYHYPEEENGGENEPMTLEA